MDKLQNKFFIMLLLDIVIILAIIIYIGERYYSNNNLKIHGVFIENPREIKDFKFTDNHNHLFTKNQLKGHWSLLFFGFTTCEIVCPTTLATLNKTYKILQNNLPESLLPQVVFISIDPENDTQSRLNQFVTSFNPRFIGARADINETMLLEKQLFISTKKINNTINHSAEILLMNPAGRVQVYFPYPAEPAKLASDYQLILSNWTAGKIR